jgi:hypothetical protein
MRSFTLPLGRPSLAVKALVGLHKFGYLFFGRLLVVIDHALDTVFEQDDVEINEKAHLKV